MPRENGLKVSRESALRYGNGPMGKNIKESRGSFHIFSRPDGSVVMCITSIDEVSRRLVRGQCAVAANESPATYQALVALIGAMEEDNCTLPQPDDVKNGERTLSL